MWRISKGALTLMIFISSICAAQNCDCITSLNQLQEKVESNYAGFADKTSKSKEAYKKLLIRLRKKAASVQNGKLCQLILEDYIRYFQDGHLMIGNIYKEANAEPISRELPSGSIETYFQSLNLPANDIRGIWKNESYQLAIVSDEKIKDRYYGLVLSSENAAWKKGMEKMVLRKKSASYYEVEYLFGDFEKIETKAFHSRNILEIFRAGYFEKVYPMQKNSISIKDYDPIFPDQDIKFSFPNDSTAVLFLGNFSNQYETVIDSLIRTHKEDLEKRAYWIVDVSYNGGGGTGTYRSLLPYLYTNPIKRSGSYYRLSVDNISQMKKFLLGNKNLPPKVAEFFRQLIEAGEKKPGSWFFEEGQRFEFSEIKKNPQKIAVLTSDETASSGEIFVMDALQSKKVTVFGTTTSGVVDYGDGFIFQIGCDSIPVSIPTRKSEYLNYQKKYDNIGINPQVAIPFGEPRPHEFIRKYYQRQGMRKLHEAK